MMGALDCVSDKTLKSTESTEVFAITLSSSNSCISDTRRELDSQNSYWSSNTRVWGFAVNTALIVVVAILFTLFELQVLPNHKGGYICNDPRLSFEFTGDTVSFAALVLTILLIPLPVIFVTERVFLETDYLFQGGWVKTMKKTLLLYRSYLFGLFLNLSLVEVMKLICGAPRPTFFAICNPQPRVPCTGSEYVSDFDCTPSDKFSAWFQSDSYHSFPSGHTSLSVHCGLFLAWYLQRRAFNWSNRSLFLVPVLQVCLLTYSAYCSLTRVTDHRHHWWDVLTGAVIGIFSTVYSAFILGKNFNKETLTDDSLKTDTVEAQISNSIYPERPLV